MNAVTLRKQYYRAYRDWIPILRNQYIRGDLETKRAIKDNVFKNWNLSDELKEKV